MSKGTLAPWGKTRSSSAGQESVSAAEFDQ